jgi:phospholipid-binding lipoprotein MlaA
MKALWFPVLLLAFIAAGCAHNLDPVVSPATAAASLPVKPEAAVSPTGRTPLSSPEAPAGAKAEKTDDFGDITEFDDLDNGGEGAKAEIADPLEPFNRAMHHFNDKLYFWFLKPVAQGYGKVVPEPARIGVDNFFKNITFPIRFVNCLLQANFGGAAEELGRFAINTVWGIGGLLDPAASKEIHLSRQDEDFGQTLGSYGIGQGFYINWPIFGPSSPRDTVGLVGDAFLRPYNYLGPWYAGTGAWAYDKVNDVSLNIGDYEALKGAAIDPYVAIRDAYVQHRLKKVKEKGGSTPSPGVAGLPKK